MTIYSLDWLLSLFGTMLLFHVNCCFLTCTQVSQEGGKMVWYSHLFKNFPQFVVIHTVKGFGIVNKTEVDVLLDLSSIFNDPMDVGNLISTSSAFSKSSLNIWSSQFMCCWSLAWRIMSIILLAFEMTPCQEPAHKIPPMIRSWGEDLTSKADQDSRDFEKLPQRSP